MTAAADPSVRISLADIYSALVQLERKVDLLALSMSEAAKSANDHEMRLRSLERRVWALPTFATLIAAGALAVSIIGVATGHW